MASKDLFVRRVYTKNGISVVVELDFVNKTVSFTDKKGEPKKWNFSHRTPEYLNGWVNILEAMKYATQEAKKELDSIKKQEYDEFLNMFIALDDSLKKPKGKK